MKKLVALLLALVLVLSLAACGGSTADNNDETKPSESQNKTEDDSTTQENPEDVEPETDEPEDDQNNKEELSFTEVVVVDNDQCLIKITGIDPDNMWGYTVKGYFENKSADKTYSFAVENGAINGVQSSPYFATDVAAGKKANENISFSSTDLGENNIGDYTDIEMIFRVYDSDDWAADPIVEEKVHIYPYGEDKASVFTREAQDTDKVLLDNEYLTITAISAEQDDFWGYSVKLFLVNKTDKNLMLGAEEVSVNGFMVDPFYAQDLMAGKCAFGSIDWDTEALEENGITAVEEIEFSLYVTDADDWLADALVEEVIKFNP